MFKFAVAIAAATKMQEISELDQAPEQELLDMEEAPQEMEETQVEVPEGQELAETDADRTKCWYYRRWGRIYKRKCRSRVCYRKRYRYSYRTYLKCHTRYYYKYY